MERNAITKKLIRQFIAGVIIGNEKLTQEKCQEAQDKSIEIMEFLNKYELLKDEIKPT